MKYLILDDLNSFQCIGSKCSCTCCKDWQVRIDSTSEKYYRNVKGKFGEKLKNSIINKEEYSYFKMEEGCCPFLNKELLCDIYLNLGEEYLCTICKVYPRKGWTYGDLTFVGKVISCPEVARILFEAASPLSFTFAENLSISNEEVDWNVFNLYVKGMTTSIEILQNHELSFQIRMRAILLFNYYFEKCLNSNSDCGELFGMFSSTESIMSLTEKMNHLNTNYNSRMALFLVIQDLSKIIDSPSITDYLLYGIDFFQNKNIENVEQFWTYDNCLKDKMNLDHIHEQYGVYYISMYYMKFFKNKQPYKFIVEFFTLFYLQICFEVFVYNKSMKPLMLSDMIDIYSKTARAFEHSLNNEKLEITFSILEKNEMSSLLFVMSLI